ncbi:sensor histidine kinase [Nonlabens marinus]|uniref:sensor histidine kinase n=1 Tax=Nonlabens marinus TaxID=930802 RepID=UPI00130E01A9|nr:sensor histidine kinase [Nonlabens marinus]
MFLFLNAPNLYAQKAQGRYLKDLPFEVVQERFEKKIFSFERAQSLMGLNQMLLADFTPHQKNILKSYKLKALVELQFFDDALELANELLEQQGLTQELQISVLLEKALIYELLDNLPESKKNLNRVARIYEDTTMVKDQNYGRYLYRLSSWYRVGGRQVESVEWAENAIDYGAQNNFLDVEATGKLLMGLNMDSTQLAKKRQYFYDGLQIWKAADNEPGEVRLTYLIAQTYIKEGDYENAFAYNDSAIELINNSKTDYFRATLYQQKAKILELQNDIANALVYQKLYTQEEIQSLNRSRKMKVKEYEYEFNKEKAVLENIKLASQLESANTNEKLLLYSVLGLGLFLISLILMFLTLAARNRKINDQNSKITQSNFQLSQSLEEKEFLLQEVNHRVKNNLAFIQSLIAFQMEETKIPESIKDFMSLNNRIQAIATVHDQFIEANSTMAHKEVPIQSYIAAIADALIQVNGSDLEYHQEIGDINVNLETAVPIGILVNELITNSIKHAQPVSKTISIQLNISEADDHLSIFYKDNGKDFIEMENAQTLGLYIIQTMVRQLRGTVTRIGSNYQIVVKRK